LLALILVALVALAAVGALTYIALRSQLTPGPSLVGKTVEVHTKRPDDQTIRGVLVAQHADRWGLTEAVYRHASGDKPIADPIVWVPKENLAWCSEPVAGAPRDPAK
jgi:hypothetical protein